MINGTSLPRAPSYVVGRPRTAVRDLSPAARAQIAAEYYKSYDVMTGVRIAATLGGIITFFGLFLFYKSRCRRPLSRRKEEVVQASHRPTYHQQFDTKPRITIEEAPQFDFPRQESQGRAVRVLMSEPHCSTSVVVVESHPPRSFSPQGIPFICSSSSSSSCSEESTGSKSARAQLTLPLPSPCSGGVPSIVVLPKDSSKSVSIVALTPSTGARPKMTKQFSHDLPPTEAYSRKGKTLSLKYKDTRGDSAETRYSSNTTSSGSRTHVSSPSPERHPLSPN